MNGWQIAELKECVESGPSFPPSRGDHGSALLRGLSPPGGIAEVLTHLPPRPTVDRLVSRFFSSMEPGVLVLHSPTFQKEYDQFWTHPQDVNLAWLSILFSIMCLAIHHHQFTEGHRPDPIGDTHGLCDDFRQQAAYCLIENKYTTPTKYTIEALMFYAQTEYFRGEEFHHEVWLLMGIINRLAMRAGLHRDGSRYPELSCFAAEMRRRIWTLMSQLDALISFQMGLPRMIYDGLADTQPPRNLLDEDFSEDSTSLPPPRPDTAFTPVAYLIAKSRLARIFGLVIDHAASTAPIPSALLYQLDKQLNESYAAVPVCLQFRSVSESVTASPRIIMLRYNLEILYQKTRCILHRKSLSGGRSDFRYAESRRICLDAAVKLLQHQATIDGQVQAGGVLGQCRWFVTSLTTNDFMLAAMVVCLELHYLEREAQGGQTGIQGKNDLLLALQTSHRIWAQYKDESAEAWQAWQSTSIMLRKLDAPVLDSVSPSDGSNSGMNASGNSTASTETETEKFDPMLGLSLDHQLDESISVAEPKMLSSLEPAFDLSHLPSELVNLWDFSGDMSWEAEIPGLVLELPAHNHNLGVCYPVKQTRIMELAQRLVSEVLGTGTSPPTPSSPKAASLIELRRINNRNVCDDTFDSQTGSIGNATASSSTHSPAGAKGTSEIPVSCFLEFVTPEIPDVVAGGSSPGSTIAISPLVRSDYIYYNPEECRVEDRRVLVEWRLRNRVAQNTVDEEAQLKRYNYRVQLLRQTSKLDAGHCMLHCFGYSLSTGQLPDGTQRPIVGLAFRFPKHAKSEAQVVTLEGKITFCTGPPSWPSPDLESRFRLAWELAVALLQIHCAGWKHREISSQYIIFFRNAEIPWQDVTKPYISGWYCSNDEFRMPGTKTGSDVALARFWKCNDIMHFAGILLSITLWKGPYEAYHNATKPNEPGLLGDDRGPFLPHYVQSLYDILRVQFGERMGMHYRKAVAQCLKAPQLAMLSTSIEKYFLDEVLPGLHKSVNN
ncbi:hypothetical protein AbraIFM66950_005771 [Aspergillus brasiliensis]|nr:hypothetical protein AbraIFM66950_005771 [Aspergillus brasiliensis]